MMEKTGKYSKNSPGRIINDKHIFYDEKNTFICILLLLFSQ